VLHLEKEMVGSNPRDNQSGYKRSFMSNWICLCPADGKK